MHRFKLQPKAPSMASGQAKMESMQRYIQPVGPDHAFGPRSYVDLIEQDAQLVEAGSVSCWKYGTMLTETENVWRRIKYRTVECAAQLVAGALGLRIATRPGAKVEKIIEIKWNDDPNGADIGGPDVQELWDMETFALAMSPEAHKLLKHWNRDLKVIDPKDYPSRTEIVIEQDPSENRGVREKTIVYLSQRDALKFMHAKNVPGFTDELIDTYARKVEGDPSLAQEVIDSLMDPTAGQQFLQAGSSVAMQSVHQLETKMQVMFESVNCLSQNVQVILKNVEKQEEMMTRHMEKQE